MYVASQQLGSRLFYFDKRFISTSNNSLIPKKNVLDILLKISKSGQLKPLVQVILNIYFDPFFTDFFVNIDKILYMFKYN